MQLIQRIDAGIDIGFSLEELLLLNNALNEVCNGIDIAEFDTRLGVSREVADKLLAEVRQVLDTHGA